jgi:single-stranded DNA-binding protein
MSIDCAAYGIVVRDAESKVSKSSKPYTRFSIRVGDGDQAQFLSVMYFSDDAAELCPKLTKGVRCYIEGSLRLDRWDKDGVPQSGLSCLSFHCRIAAIGRHKQRRERKPDDRKPSAGAQVRRNDFHSDEIPF